MSNQPVQPIKLIPQIRCRLPLCELTTAEKFLIEDLQAECYRILGMIRAERTPYTTYLCNMLGKLLTFDTLPEGFTLKHKLNRMAPHPQYGLSHLVCKLLDDRYKDPNFYNKELKVLARLQWLHELLNYKAPVENTNHDHTS